MHYISILEMSPLARQLNVPLPNLPTVINPILLQPNIQILEASDQLFHPIILSYIITTHMSETPLLPSYLQPTLTLLLVLINHSQPILIISSLFLIYCNFCAPQMTESVPDYIRTIKYRITATIHRVKISKRARFYTKVQWKRNQNQATTSLVLHQDQLSLFNEALELEYSFHYDTQENLYLEKKCDMIVIVDQNGDGETIKNGGYVRFDLSEVINDSQQTAEKKLYLLKSPDPDAYIEFSLLYEPVEEVYPLEMSMHKSMVPVEMVIDLEQSELKTSSKTEIDSVEEPNSETEFKEAGLGQILNKFEKLSRQLKSKIKENDYTKDRKSDNFEIESEREMPQSVADMQEQIRELRRAKNRLESQLEYIEDQKRDLERLLDKKSRQIVTKSHEMHEMNTRIEELLSQKGHKPPQLSGVEEISLDNMDQSEEQSIRQKYKLQSQELEELKMRLAECQKRSKEKEAENWGGMNRSSSTISNRDDGKQVQLERMLANKSHQIGELFNAAFEIGGAPLLDKLQSAIGLVEIM